MAKISTAKSQRAVWLVICLSICAFCIHFSMLRSIFDVLASIVKIGSSEFSLGFKQSTASFDNGTFTYFWAFCIFILLYKVLPSGALTIFPHVNERTSLRRSLVKQENRNARFTSSQGQGVVIAAFISSNVRYSLMLSVDCTSLLNSWTSGDLPTICHHARLCSVRRFGQSDDDVPYRC